MRACSVNYTFDPETNTYIEDRWYRHGSGWWRQVSRPAGLPDTTLWKRMTLELPCNL